MYELGFKHPEYENYTGLETMRDVEEALREECEKSVIDMGSEAYDPGDYLPPGHMHDRDEPDEQAWLDATEEAIRVATDALLHRRMRDLRDQGDATLPDGTIIYLIDHDDEEEN